jgi:hypothetical protein
MHAGVRVVWLLDPKERRCEVLVADQGEWRQHQQCGDKGQARLVPFECEEIDLENFWDTPEQHIQKIAGMADGLARALDDAVARGANEGVLFTLLLKTIDVEATPWEDEVVGHLLRSDSVLLLARALVACRVPIKLARSAASEERLAARYMATLKPEQAEALCERYCELVEERGPGCVNARELRLRAHVWARHRLGSRNLPRVDHDQSATEQERSLAGAQMLDACANTGSLSDAARTFVMNGPGAWRASANSWNEVSAAVIAQLEEPFLPGEEHVVELASELGDHLRKRNPTLLIPPVECTDEELSSDSAFDALEPLYSDLPMRPILDDIALEWRLVKRELECEMTELRQTGRLPPALEARLSSGHGMSLLTEAERALVESAPPNNATSHGEQGRRAHQEPCERTPRGPTE